MPRTGTVSSVAATDVFGTDGAGDSHRVAVTRYTPGGGLDKTFGVNGTFAYDVSDTHVFDLKYTKAVATADGGLLVAFDLQSLAGRQSLSEVVLLKITARGRRDASYGTGGTKVVMTGASMVDSNGRTGDVTLVAGADLTLNADGSARVLLSRVQGRGVSPFGLDPDEGVNGTYQIKSRTVTADGRDEPDRAYSWTLATPSATPGTNTRFAPLLIADDGPTGLTVIGRAHDGGAVTRPLAYRLRAGRRVAASPFATGKVTARQVVRTDQGHYYAFLNDQTVARLTSDFALDPAFAEGGIGRPNLDGSNPSIMTPRLFAVPGDRVIVGFGGRNPSDTEYAFYVTRLG